MHIETLEVLREDIKKLCHTVGAYQLVHLGSRSLETNSKSTLIDIVTEADVKSEEMIISFIKQKFPNHNILAEESGVDEKNSPYKWIIDPIDGTINYAHGYPFFAIAIGLEYKEEMILSCIYLPYLDEFYSAIKGEGAYCNDKKISVSHTETMDLAVIATGFPYDKKTNPNNNLDYFGKIMPQLAGIRRSGSACCDLVMVACGKTDGYFEMYLNLWDFRAGSLLIEEAGGKVRYNKLQKGYSIVATNDYIFDELLGELLRVKEGDY